MGTVTGGVKLAEVELRNVNKRYGDVHVVHDANLVVQDKEFVVLVGPSGCGKSTTLRMIAGLEEISSGDLLIAGKRMNDVAPKDRDIAMVFQSYALYPHMSVRQNLAFGLKLRHTPKDEIERRVQEVAAILGLGEFLDRKPKQLSGGQRQRVAMGRAIVRQPKVFLFDEPLSNLDAKLRVQMRLEISKLHNRLQSTVVYVTHDQVEAMTLADRIVVMKDGAIQQVGSPLEVYNQPHNLFVAGFIGSPAMNMLEGRLTGQGGEVAVEGEEFKVRLPATRWVGEAPALGAEVVLGVRPQDMELAWAGSGGETMRAKVEVIEPMGSESYIFASLGNHSLTMRVEASAKVTEGEAIPISVPLGKIHLFDKRTERALFKGVQV